jgi:DNA polymerase elongation subunit (family B)
MSFNLLSDEIILIIFSYIDDFFDVKRLVLVSKKFKYIIEYRYKIYFFPVDVEDSSLNDKYILKIYGVFENGKKLLVNIHNYEPYFDILLTNSNTSKEIYKIYNYKKSEIVKKYPIIGYSENKLNFLRLYFNNNQKRKQVINLLRQHNFITYSDDRTFHYRKVARENNIYLTMWNELTKYRHYKCENTGLDVFDIEINNIRLSKSQIEIKQLIVLAWDIETSSTRQGELPNPQYDEDEVFMICLSLHNKDMEKPIKKICITTQECDKGEDWKLIVCDNQEELILLFAKIIIKLKPNFIIGFNDSAYDWPFIINKSKRLGIYVKFGNILLQKNYRYNEQIEFYERTTQIKIGNESVKSTIFKIPGVVCIDIRISLRKLYEKTEKSSLNFFLEMMGLNKKLDLQPHLLWKYYQDSKNNILIGNDKVSSKKKHKENIKKIAEYCFYDALSCQLLNLNQYIIDGYIESSKLSFISLYDSYAYGNSIKLKNYNNHLAFGRDILTSMITDEKERDNVKYPGGYVFNPITGLNNKRPVSCLDVISLYPSIIMAFNFSPEKIIFKDTINNFKDEDLFKIEFEYNDEKIEAWVIRHNGQNSEKGIYVLAMENLINIRTSIKEQLKYEKNPLERIKLDIKQKAIKVYMNSFYGETGNSISPLYLVELAGGITATGRNILKLISNKLISEYKCKIMYGDTDSTFFEISDIHYETIDAKFNNNEITKQQYWTEMVNKSHEVTEKIKDEINEFLILYSNTTYIKIAFDGILYPSQFIDKKKYMGKLHKEYLKFKDLDDELLYWLNHTNHTVGLDVVKKGQSLFFKNIGYEIINTILNIENEYSNIEIIENVIEHNINEVDNVDIINFTKTAIYKPLVKNLSVQNFIERMKNNNIQIPEPGERFNYIVTKQGKIKNIGERMEFVEIFQKNNEMKLDILYYFNSVVNICSGFIVDELFDVNVKDRNKQSIKYVKKLINRIYENKFNNTITKYYNVKQQKINIIRKNKLNDVKQTNIDLYYKLK